MKDKLKDAIEILKNHGVVGMPTETVYGLAASIDSEDGIKKIFSTKERPFFDPLIVHVSSIDQAKTYVKSWPNLCDQLAQKYWPGPLTFILPKNDNVSDMITSGLDTVGIRLPKHPIAQELINKLGTPVAAPSANKFKKTSPTKATHVQNEFPEVHVLEGGDSEIGIESTIIGFEENMIKIYRPGMIGKDELQELFEGQDVEIEYVESPVAPGHLKHHYMPKTPLVTFIQKDESHSLDLNLLPDELKESPSYWHMPTDANLCARELYSKFKEFDTAGCSAIIIPIPDSYLEADQWKGILNRLKKAASIKIDLPK